MALFMGTMAPYGAHLVPKVIMEYFARLAQLVPIRLRQLMLNVCHVTTCLMKLLAVPIIPILLGLILYVRILATLSLLLLIRIHIA